MNVIFIDTSSNEEVKVGLQKGEKIQWKNSKAKIRNSQIVLQLVDVLLKENDLTVNDITEIQVNTGPGSFTGLRVGIAIANALAFTLKIPVNKKNISEFVDATYT